MKTDRMTFMEVENAALNLSNIEASLGHEIPAGLIDAKSLGDHRMTFMEVENAALNLSNIMDAKNRKVHWSKTKLYIIRFLFAISALVVAFFLVCIIYAFFTEVIFY